MDREPAPITDLSDKGRRAGKTLRYKVAIYQTPRRETSNETPVVVAAFRSFGDAFKWANDLRIAPCVTEVLLHN